MGEARGLKERHIASQGVAWATRLGEPRTYRDLSAMRRIRAVTFSLLLTGGLLPPVVGIPMNLIAAVVAAPLVVYEIIRILPIVHPVVIISAWLFTPLILAGLIGQPPTGQYGTEKFENLWSSTLLSAVGAVLIRDRPGLLTFGKVWVGIGSFLAIYALIFGTQDQGRAEGFGSNPIWLSRALATAVIFAVWLLWRRSLRILPGSLALGILVMGVFATGSRGPTLGMLVGLAAFSLLVAKNWRLLMGGYLFALVALVWVVPTIWVGIVNVRAIGFLYEQDASRSAMWARTLDVIAQNPGGVGYGRWNAETAPWLPFRYPHNMFLEVAEEAGWIVIAVLVLVVFYVIARVLLSATTDPTCAVMFSAIIAETVGVNLSGDVNARTFFGMLCLGYAVLRMPHAQGVGVGNSVASPPAESHVQSRTSSESVRLRASSVDTPSLEMGISDA